MNETDLGSSKELFCDLRTDEEKSNFFLSGRGHETGVISLSIQNDVAMAYHRCAEYAREIERLQQRLDKCWDDAKQFEEWATPQLTHYAEQRDEIERLQRELDQAHDKMEDLALSASAPEPPAALDRYSIELHGEVCGPAIRETLDPNGEWVLYEDVAPFLRAAQPQPAELSHFKVLGICDAYESGYGFGLNHQDDAPNMHNPYKHGTPEYEAHVIGEGKGREAERASQPPCPEWQPIETAPKDGTEIALLFPREDSFLGRTLPKVRAASWYRGAWSIPHFTGNMPTHWQFLPAAPCSETTKPVVLGVDPALPGTDRTVYQCPRCLEIITDWPAIGEHAGKCSASGERDE